MISVSVRRWIALSLCFAAAYTTGCRRESKEELGAMPGTATWGPPMNPFMTRALGDDFVSPPKISFVDFVDLNADGVEDIVASDCETDRVIALVRDTDDTESSLNEPAFGTFREQTILADIEAPAAVAHGDIDGDGDMDLAVAILGQLLPTNEKIGSLVLLEQVSELEYEPHRIFEDSDRTSDVRFGDIDQDGDLDLAVTQFGYNDGKFGWLENQGDFKFLYHELLALEGGIHGILEDVNQDGNLDAVVLISQELERIYCFEGDGQGNFREHLVYQAPSDQFGSSGIWLGDLDGDSMLDILYTNGDAFDYSPPHPWPWHGIQWLQNQGDFKFEFERIVEFGGVTAASLVDWDRDGDTDVFAGSTFNDWNKPESQSLIYLENDGRGQFTARPVTNTPTHIQCMATSDVNADGIPDFVTGGMHVFEPYDRVQRLQLWISHPQD